MFDSFSEAGKAVMDETKPISIALGHNYIGTEHVLLALLAHEERVGGGPLTARGVTTADVRVQALEWLSHTVSDADSLRSMGVDPDAIVRETKSSLGADLQIQGIVKHPLHSLTPRVFKVLNLAVGVAATQPAEPRHILQALLEEDGGLAVIVLDRLGVDLESLQAALSG